MIVLKIFENSLSANLQIMKFENVKKQKIYEVLIIIKQKEINQ